MDWFEAITGFNEGPYEDTRAKLRVEGARLRSLVNNRSYAIGQLELVSLDELRARAKQANSQQRRTKVNIVRGDVRAMHRAPEYAKALFQVASQFNLLEMTSEHITPEMGVTRYQHDFTQGPACAIATGAATIYRNYFVPINDAVGQTSERQLDGLADIGAALSLATGHPISDLWAMQNGYALCTPGGLRAIARHIRALELWERAALLGKLRIGLHWDVEVTDAATPDGILVSQAFCSALPVAYSSIAAEHWEEFACLVLEAAYEATMWAAVLNAQRGASNVVLLTLVGGGAFGNRDTWIYSALRRSLELVREHDLDVRLVSHRTPSEAMLKLANAFEQ